MGDRLLSSTNIPTTFQGVGFDAYDPGRGDPTHVKQLSDWEPKKTPNLFLYGPPGLGKTMLACATLQEQQEQRFSCDCPDLDSASLTLLRQRKWPVYFLQLAEFIDLNIRIMSLRDDVRAGIRDPAEYLETDRLLQDLKHRVKLLVLDDIGKEHRTASNYADDSFDLLVRTRHNNGLFTIFTSNISLNRLKHCNYTDSMQNFFARTSLVLDFK